MVEMDGYGDGCVVWWSCVEREREMSSQMEIDDEDEMLRMREGRDFCLGEPKVKRECKGLKGRG